MKEKIAAVFNAVTDIDWRYIREAEEHRAKRPAWSRWGAGAALLALVLGLSLFLAKHTQGPGAQSGGGSAPEDGYFSAYYGPVLPLTALGDLDGLSAARTVDYDFTHTGENGYPGTALVTDRYVLTNQTGQDKTLKLCYPLSGSLEDEERSNFTCTVDGAAVEPTFHIGFRVPQTRQYTSSWNEYRQLLEQPGNLSASLAPEPELTETAIVYTLRKENPGTGEEDRVNLRFRVDLDHTKVFATGFVTYSVQELTGSMMVGFYMDRREQTACAEPCTLVLLGGDLEDPVLDWPLGDGAEGWRLDRRETTLAQVLEDESEWLASDVRLSETDSGAVARLLEEDGLSMKRQDGNWELHGAALLISQARNSPRVMYESFDVTVPAGGSLTVELRQRKSGSYQLGGRRSGSGEGIGYDLVTQAGSALVFTEQRASVTGLAYVRLGDNNFGFVPEQGITSVVLDPEIPCYWMRLGIRQ